MRNNIIACSYYILSTLLIYSLPYSSLGYASASEAKPTLAISKPIHNFGSVQEGSKVEHVFQIQNTGSALLEIKRVFPACGCTAAVLDNSSIPPGASGSVKVSFDTSGFNGFKVKTIRLYTNDPKLSSAVLSLEGTVRPEVVIDPPRANFGLVKKGDSPSIKIIALPDSKSNVKITDVLSRSPQIEVLIEEYKKGGKTGKIITAKLKNNTGVGVFRNNIIIKTNSKKSPVSPIPVFARIQGDLKLIPQDAAFGLLEGPLKEATEKNIKLINNTGSEISIEKIKSDNPNVIAEVIENSDNSSELIKVSLKSGTTGTIRSQVTITTNHPDSAQKKIVLPVYGIVTRKSS